MILFTRNSALDKSLDYSRITVNLNNLFVNFVKFNFSLRDYVQ